jgi:hypothetical protein
MIAIPRLRRFAAPLGMTMVLAACNAEEAIRQMTPADADARAREYIALFTRRQVDSALGKLLPTQVTSEAREQLSLIATVDTAGTWFVEGVSARTLDRSLEQQTRFTFAGKSPVHYVWLLIMVVVATFSSGTAIFIATRRGMPRRWWWVFASLIGVSPVDLNWATSVVNTRMLSVQLFAAAFVRAGPAAPWILTFALPLGAGLALERHARWKRERERRAESSDLPTVQLEDSP